MAGITFGEMREISSSDPLTIFLSGSIPDPQRWEGVFDPLEITDAVVTFARACLTRGYTIVTAAHPTIAPLLLYVAAEFPQRDSPAIRIYQSTLFEDVLPSATRRFSADGIGRVTWTAAVRGEAPSPGLWDESLRVMREEMLTEEQPDAAVFIGGMNGINQELSLFTNLRPSTPWYATVRPGGAAARLGTDVTRNVSAMDERGMYPALWANVLDSFEARDLRE